MTGPLRELLSGDICRTSPVITCTCIHLADAFIQSNLQLRNTISDSL